MTLKDQLIKMNACTEAVEWVGDKNLYDAWRTCERGDWMLWLAGRLNIDRKLLVLAACYCAEPALKYVVEGENRPANAIKVARDWCAGKATLEAVKTAAAAAAAAAYAAADAAADAHAHAAAAAHAAAYAAAAAAAYADAHAAYAAAAAAAYAASLKRSATLARKRIPYAVIRDAMKGEMQ